MSCEPSSCDSSPLEEACPGAYRTRRPKTSRATWDLHRSLPATGRQFSYHPYKYLRCGPKEGVAVSRSSAASRDEQLPWAEALPYRLCTDPWRSLGPRNPDVCRADCAGKVESC